MIDPETFPPTTVPAPMTETATAPTETESTLTVQAPDGAHFEFDEVKTEKGTKSLGTVPLLTWDDPQKMIEFYGAEGVLAIVNGTSLRVTFQGKARRLREDGKTDDEIAEDQIRHRPGTRSASVSTPTSRARKAAEAAVAAKGAKGDMVTALLERLASGDITDEQVAALLGS